MPLNKQAELRSELVAKDIITKNASACIGTKIQHKSDRQRLDLTVSLVTLELNDRQRLDLTVSCEKNYESVQRN